MQDLKSRCDITDIVSSYVNLKRRGKNMVGLCPFHNEKSPSFNVYPENNSFYCFGCGAGGDVITFIRKIENLDYIEAVKMLADRVGLQMPEQGVDDSMSRLRQRVLEINRESARFFHSALLSPEGKPGLDYFARRRLPMKMIRHFGLGWGAGKPLCARQSPALQGLFRARDDCGERRGGDALRPRDGSFPRTRHVSYH